MTLSSSYRMNTRILQSQTDQRKTARHWVRAAYRYEQEWLVFLVLGVTGSNRVSCIHEGRLDFVVD